MFRLNFPEMIIIFFIFLFLFGPRLGPAVLQKVRSFRPPTEEVRDPDWWNILFGLLMALAFIYGVVKTLQLLR